jgi:uncharacterized membrane protein YeiH
VNPGLASSGYEVALQIATAIFAVTGVLAAARRNMDVLSFVIVGLVTAIGGGTLRDILLGMRVFWLRDPNYVYVAAVAAIATFFLEQRFRATLHAFLYLDATGTAVFAATAAAHTLGLGFPSGIAVVMGVLTGIGGGVLRDLLTGDPTLLARRELFMTPILLGLLFYVGALHAAPQYHRAWTFTAIVLIAAVRIGAIRFNWAFPDWLTYKPFKPS